MNYVMLSPIHWHLINIVIKSNDQKQNFWRKEHKISNKSTKVETTEKPFPIDNYIGAERML